MAQHGKRYNNQVKKIGTEKKPVIVSEAVSKVKSTASAKFDESVDIAINLGVEFSFQLVLVASYGADITAVENGGGGAVVGNGQVDLSQINARDRIMVQQRERLDPVGGTQLVLVPVPAHLHLAG